MKKRSPYNVNTQIRSALRKVWRWSPMRRDALTRARVGYGKYLCSACGEVVGPTSIEVDHDVPATPAEGIRTPREWGIFVERLLFADAASLKAICKPCHKVKTNEERKISKSTKAKNRKA